MLGYPVDFASFYILEVMSRTEFAHKRVGYLAAGQVFSPTTDVLLLTTNLFKKVRVACPVLGGWEALSSCPVPNSVASTGQFELTGCSVFLPLCRGIRYAPDICSRFGD